jgi:hypothetical protein
MVCFDAKSGNARLGDERQPREERSFRLRAEGGMTWLSDLAVAGLTITSDIRMTCGFGKGKR